MTISSIYPYHVRLACSLYHNSFIRISAKLKECDRVAGSSDPGGYVDEKLFLILRQIEKMLHGIHP